MTLFQDQIHDPENALFLFGKNIFFLGEINET